MTDRLDQVLSTAEDLVVIDPTNLDSIAFAFPLKGETAKHYFDKTLANPEERDICGFQEHWKYDDKSGLITGSSTFLALRMDEAVRSDGFRIPTPQEARQLDAEGRLSNGVYRDFGMAVYNDGNPNQEIAKEIISQAGERKLPLIIPFNALAQRVDESFPQGLVITPSGDPKGIISGDEARQYINDNFNYKGNSGARGLGRVRDGRWVAYWDGLDFSNDGGRVDWLCGEATRADLETAHKAMSDRQYGGKIKELTKERDAVTAKFTESLNK